MEFPEFGGLFRVSAVLLVVFFIVPAVGRAGLRRCRRDGAKMRELDLEEQRAALAQMGCSGDELDDLRLLMCPKCQSVRALKRASSAFEDTKAIFTPMDQSLDALVRRRLG